MLPRNLSNILTAFVHNTHSLIHTSHMNTNTITIFCILLVNTNTNTTQYTCFGGKAMYVLVIVLTNSKASTTHNERVSLTIVEHIAYMQNIVGNNNSIRLRAAGSICGLDLFLIFFYKIYWRIAFLSNYATKKKFNFLLLYCQQIARAQK